jgi:hypothetical protein
MANTRPDVTLVANLWVDIYAATGIAVGTALQIYNKGNTKLCAQIKATSPSDLSSSLPIFEAGNYGSTMYVSAGESGFWLYSVGRNGLVNVQEVL